MFLRISVAELELLALRGEPRPEALTEVVGEADTLRTELDLRKVPSDSLALTLASKAAGVIRADATFDRFDRLTQTASFTLTLRSRGLPAHRLINLFTGRVNKLLNPPEGTGPLPPGVIALEPGDEHPVLTVDLGTLLTEATKSERFLTGSVRSFTLTGGHVELDVEWVPHR